MGFEPTIQEFERVKTVHALDRVATVIGSMEDVRKKISKANGAFNQLQKV
jgi:hypothetical protein